MWGACTRQHIHAHKKGNCSSGYKTDDSCKHGKREKPERTHRTGFPDFPDIGSSQKQIGGSQGRGWDPKGPESLNRCGLLVEGNENLWGPDGANDCTTLHVCSISLNCLNGENSFMSLKTFICMFYGQKGRVFPLFLILGVRFRSLGLTLSHPTSPRFLWFTIVLKK